MLPRVLEPEVMDSREEAVAYDAMDHREVNQRFVDDLLAAIDATPRLLRIGEAACRALDLGTGTALIPILLAQRWQATTGPSEPLQITAVDLAPAMLEVARANVAAAGLQQVIALELADAKALDEHRGSFDVVMSNSIVHHIAEPGHVLAAARRLVRPGGLLFFRDLLRPADRLSLERLVDTYAADADAYQREMFANSLHAALTLDEVRALVEPIGCPANTVQVTSDRHWTLSAVIALR